jgi:hypothetical protein
VKLPALTEFGETLEREGVGFKRVMALGVELVLSATVAAVTEMVFGEGIEDGAV